MGIKNFLDTLNENKSFVSLKQNIEKKRSQQSILWSPIIFLKDITREIKKNIDFKYYFAEIVEEPKVICFYINKSASTSLKVAFKGKRGLVNMNNLHKFKDYFKFAFVKNPYSRIVSCYKAFIVEKNPSHVEGMSQILWRYNRKFWPNMNFKDFVKGVSKIPDKESDGHFRSQYYFIIDRKGKLIPNFIGKVENSQEDYERLCKLIGIKKPIKLPHNNKTKASNYKKYYDEETKEIVKKRYSRDLNLFNYEF